MGRARRPMGISRQSSGTLPAMDEVTEHPGDTALAAPAFAYVDFGVAHGLPREQLVAAARLTESMRADPDARCPLSAFVLLWRELLVRLPDVAVSLELGRTLDLDALGVIHQIVPRADTLQHAQALTARFLRLTDTALGFRGLERGGLVGAALVHRPEVVATKHPVEVMIAIGARLLAAAVGGPVVEEVWLAHAPLHAVSAYEEAFGAPVRFEQADSVAWIARAAMERPLPGRDPAARRYLEVYAQRALETVAAAPPPFVATVRGAVLVELATSGAELARVARRLAVSTRTLQRRLEEAGTTYQDTVDGVRADLARALLRERSRSIVDVAFELGYADLKSFYRAFRRWTDTTPGEWRARHAP